MSTRIRLRRVYDPGTPEDGNRVLVDRLWPRGLRKDAVRLQHWARELAPSNELRRWFGHDPGKWDEFRRRYADELDGNPEAVAALLARLDDGPLTLLHAARDTAPADRVLGALEAAEAFSAGVRRPFRVEQTPNAEISGARRASD